KLNILSFEILSFENIFMENSDIYHLYREVLVQLEFGNHQALRPFNLTVHQFDALCILSEKTGVRMGELKDRLLSDNSKMTRTVDYLESNGLAERRPDPIDRRAQVVFLTEAGQQLRNQATVVHTQYLHQKFSALSEGEKNQLVTLLQKMRYAHE
ncbi:MAG: MarR family transcriptional regulator, partial [Chloroflexota bacterium]